MKIKNGIFLLGDCLERMQEIPDGSVDMVLCDLPYGTTQNKWDSVIPFEPLWAHYWRVCKPNAAVILTAQAPFDKILAVSQLSKFKHQWIWEKTAGTGFLNAKRAPLKCHEIVMVFGTGTLTYRPIMTDGHEIKRVNPTVAVDSENYGKPTSIRKPYCSTQRFPRDVLKFAKDNRIGKPHPTQKPVALFEYLIRTYTDEGMTVLDNCAGSGTTAVAAENSGRKWICIEKDPKYYYRACSRILGYDL